MAAFPSLLYVPDMTMERCDMQASKSGRVGWARVAYVDLVLSLSARAPASSLPNPSPMSALGRILNRRLLSSQHYYSFYRTKSQDIHVLIKSVCYSTEICLLSLSASLHDDA